MRNCIAVNGIYVGRLADYGFHGNVRSMHCSFQEQTQIERR